MFDDLGPGVDDVRVGPRQPLRPLPDKVDDCEEAIITESVDHIVTVTAGGHGRDAQLRKLVAFANLRFQLVSESLATPLILNVLASKIGPSLGEHEGVQGAQNARYVRSPQVPKAHRSPVCSTA